MTTEQETSSEKRTKILRQVRALLDTAASHRGLGNYEAADSYEAKADQLMTAYTIESFELEMAKPVGHREAPLVREFEYGKVKDTGDWRSDSDVNRQMYEIFHGLAQFCRVKVGWLGYYSAKVVGYEADLEYLDFLFTMARIHLQGNMEPKPRHELSEYENFKIMKEAGMKWERIWALLHPGEEFNRSYCQRLLKQYRDECAREGKPQMKGDPRIYQRSFMSGFVDELRHRLWKMSDRRDVGGKGLVLANRDEDLLEALWKEFPALKPHPKGCDCDIHHRCHDPKCQRKNCVAARKPEKAYKAPPEPKMDYSARANGAQAAQKLDLSRGREAGAGGRTGELGG
jgi:hypothetical protein